jgi:hypothetical protein
MPEEQLVYLFCVTADPPDLGIADAHRGGLHLIHEAGLHAVVCRVEAGDFDQANLRRNLDDLSWVAAETTKHERIVEAVMRDRCVIPFRFATLFNTGESLRTLMRAQADRFRTLLEQLANKAEWGVKVYCDEEKLSRDIHAQDDTVSSLDEAIHAASPGEAFLLSKERERSMKIALADRTDPYAEPIMQALGEFGVQVRIHDVLPPGATEGYGTMILNAAFLVRNPDARAFVETTNTLSERYADEGLFIECSGPWPPYNFCDPAKAAANE